MLLKSLFLALLALGAAPALAQTTPAPDRDGLGRYAAANRALPAPQPGRPRVVLLGNSITDAWPRADSAFFADRRYELVGRGISGQTTPQMLVRFRQDVLDLHPAVVVILAGINDIAQNTGPYDQQATLNNIKSMTELAQAHGVRVVLSSVLPAYDFAWRRGLEPAPKVLALNQQLRAYAAERGATYLNYHAAMADSRQGLPPALSKDEVHPTLAGYQVMEPLLMQAIAQALKTKEKPVKATP
ncbi:acylhydrolase [Hymenobacter sp. RP-2-7]|uniref:Acylhydrolase n=1 Tax=Hymenobacter polaris TaxID=2682546 RepID=A0A7Y0AIA3_9BACT|nr:GDSL-type esterase/lipase family protein [Hymenobacter polaris]NML67794.1 acylhydrolase [Hymenobacter polaris]